MRTASTTLVILVALYFLAGRHIYERISAEIGYRHQYGAAWKEHYAEDRHVTVEEDHKKLFVASGSIALVVTLCFLIYRQAVPKRSGRRRSRHRRSHSSPIPS
jgi:hypothetical protein